MINIDNVKLVKLDSNIVTSDSLQCEGPLLGADDEGSDWGTDEDDELASKYSSLRFSAYFTRLAWAKSLLLRTDVSYGAKSKNTGMHYSAFHYI